ncbi:MAG: chorismate-binding protein [Akkermansia sp.]|nr:chorismate-binding protein [Akkermansia sp.]
MSFLSPQALGVLDALCRSGSAFALYRLPGAEDCRLVLQHGPGAEVLPDFAALAGRSGFVAAPFAVSAECPAVLIRPDVAAEGIWQIEQALAGVQPEPCGTLPGPSAESRAADKPGYMRAFGMAMDALRAGRVGKVVLSRTAVQEVPPFFSPAETFCRACECYPSAMACLFHSPQTGTWLAATPEQLLCGGGLDWQTVALAGTMPLQDGARLADWDAKNRAEQAHVVDYIRDTVGACAAQVWERGPVVSPAGRLAHLRSDFRFRLQQGAEPCALLQALHPTPAVCGRSKEAARRVIAECEPAPRRYYSGFFGMWEPAGRTDIFVNLRCMQIHAGCVTLHAGGGLVPESAAEPEWLETEAKMNTLRSLLT